jgi:glycosyltransferase involved in cell wall biosynthesis
MKKISIITINYNDKNGLEKTIESVISQSSKDFEYIIIDGNSTDGSKELIEKNNASVEYWVSEPDSGIYNAMNKGIRAAKGEYLLFLNSGDYLCDNNTIQNVVDSIDEDKDLYYGDAVFMRGGKDEVVTFPDKLSFYFFTHNSLCHQASFIKRTLFEEVFYYNENLSIISDWEFMVYCICIKNISYKHIDITVAYYDYDGISSRPNSKSIISLETEIVMNKYFSAFLSDYKYITAIKERRVKDVIYIKQFPIAWKVLKKCIKAVLLVLPKQKQ